MRSGKCSLEVSVSEQTPGDELHLSIDVELSQAMYDLIATTTARMVFEVVPGYDRCGDWGDDCDHEFPVL